MTDIANLTNVAYKKGNWMRYTLWALAAVCIGILIYSFVGMMNGDVSASVPEGYKFAVTDSYEGSKVRTTYYVYDDKIMVEEQGFHDNKVDRAVMIYDGVSTLTLTLNSDDTTEICEYGVCHSVPKVVDVIKRLLSRKVGREYIGL